jgi:Na+-driven multidrug efflux pump
VTILKLILVLVPFQLTSLAGFYYLQIRHRSGLYTALQTAKFLFEVGMNFWLVGALGWGVRGFLMSILAGEILTSLFLTGGILLRLGPRIDFRCSARSSPTPRRSSRSASASSACTRSIAA